MRSHGVASFPLPVTHATGTFTLAITPAITHSPHFHSAFAYCRTLVPNSNEGPTITPADEADYLKAVACLRSHGFDGFPDPTISKNRVHFDVPPSINQNSPQFEQARQTCERLIPAGLPYTGTS